MSKDPKMRSFWVRKCKLRQKYNLTIEGWEDIFNAQGRCCAVCKSTDPRGKVWHTDHDHRTNKLRGILCAKCNLALGQVDDSVDVLKRLAQYLEEHGRS